MRYLPIFILLILMPSIYAWTGYTHEWICERAGLPPEVDCAAADTPAIQSKYPDVNFRNHHCTNNSEDCSARKIADTYMIFSHSDARDISAHLYADSMVPVHWYSTDYDTCHKIFEDRVEEKLKDSEYVKHKILGKEYDFSEWNISMQCTAKYGKVNMTVDLYADNIYMEGVAKYVAEKMGVAPETITYEMKEYDWTPVLLMIILFLILILTLFLYQGIKLRRSHK